MAQRQRRTPPPRRGGRVQISVPEIQRFLASDACRRLRRLLAGSAIIAAPLLFRIPGLKRYPLIKGLELVGGAAIVVKLAERIRDWEPENPQPIVIDVPPQPGR